MGAVRQHIHTHDHRLAKSRREIPPADYNDEISDEQLAEMRKQVADCIDSDEWVIIDGPAW